MKNVPQLRTPGIIANELGVPVARVQYVLRKRPRDIQPIGRAGTLRLFDQAAVARIRHELNAQDARRAGRAR